MSSTTEHPEIPEPVGQAAMDWLFATFTEQPRTHAEWKALARDLIDHISPAIHADPRKRLLSDEACMAGAKALRPDASEADLGADAIEVRLEAAAALDSIALNEELKR